MREMGKMGKMGEIMPNLIRAGSAQTLPSIVKRKSLNPPLQSRFPEGREGSKLDCWVIGYWLSKGALGLRTNDEGLNKKGL